MVGSRSDLWDLDLAGLMISVKLASSDFRLVYGLGGKRVSAPVHHERRELVALPT